MKKIFLLLCMFILFMTIPGCGCNQTSPPEEQATNELQPDFKGPDGPPYSAGPTEPPPSE